MTILSFLALVLLVLLAERLLYRRFWHKRLDMTLAFSAREAFEGDSLVLQEDVTNAKPLPLPMLAAKFRLSRNLVFEDEPQASVSDHYYQTDVFAVNLYQHITRRHPFQCAKRGYYRVDSMELVAQGLFHNATLVSHQKSDAELTVFPRLAQVDSGDVLWRQVLGEVEVRRFTNPDPFAFRGIREYEPGDDFRHINYKASAKSGGLMVNQYSPTSSQEVVVLLNVEPYAAASRESVLEEAIRLAAGAAVAFAARGLAVGFVCNGQDILTGEELAARPGSGQGHLHAILQNCARIDLRRQVRPFATVLRESPLLVRDGLAPAPYYLLVSPYDGEDLAAAFLPFAAGQGGHWLLPMLAGATPRVPESAAVSHRRI